jgi:hypothetical protein
LRCFRRHRGPAKGFFDFGHRRRARLHAVAFVPGRRACRLTSCQQTERADQNEAAAVQRSWRVSCHPVTA